MPTSVSTRASPYQAETPATSSDVRVDVTGVVSVMGCSEVGGDDALVVAHLVVAALGEHLPRLEDGHGAGERSDDVHVVVDEDDGAAHGELLDERDRALDVL